MHNNRRQLRTSALNMHPELLVIPARLPRPFSSRRRFAALSFPIFQFAHEDVFSGQEMVLFPKVSQTRLLKSARTLNAAWRQEQMR